MHDLISIYFAFGAAAATCAFVLTRLYIRLSIRRNWVDRPNERSSHKVATPRGGGVAILLTWILMTLVLMITFREHYLLSVLLPISAIIASLGFVDDLFSLRASTRLAVQLACAMTFAIYLLSQRGDSAGSLMTGVLLTALITMLLVSSVNFFNFMDGTDGLASTQSFLFFSTAAFFFSVRKSTLMSFASIVIAFASLGFLFWNWPKAKVFMGDIGSCLLGFLVASFAIIGTLDFEISFLTWIILHGAFLFDALVTLMRRFLNGEKWWEAHRSHTYQRLHHKLGWSHLKILITFGVLNLVLISLSVTTFYFEELKYVISLAALVLLTSLYLKVDALEKRQAV